MHRGHGLCLTLLLLATSAAAQVTTDDLQDPGARAEKVDSATSWKRVDERIRYLRPGAEFTPDGQIEIRVPPKPRSREQREDDNRLGLGLLFGTILLGIILAFIFYGNRINVSFGRTKDRSRRVAGEGSATGDLTVGTDGRNHSLEEIAAMADRREALIVMTSRALERSARLNDIRLARAQTARDVLRALPRQWAHFGAIRRLVREAEIVHFGGREITEAAFQECLDAARPIFTARGASA